MNIHEGNGYTVTFTRIIPSLIPLLPQIVKLMKLTPSVFVHQQNYSFELSLFFLELTSPYEKIHM